MSKIQWTDLTQNPLRVATGGHYCEKVSPGCQFCYAESMNMNPWFKGNGQPYKPTKAGPPEMVLDAEMLASWARARKPKKRFICSMTDMFGEWVPDGMIFEILDAMGAAPKQTFQILTKRPERMAHLAARWMYENKITVFPANIWFGASAENQKTFLNRFPWLFSTAAQTQFLSLEPLLGPINLGINFHGIDWVIIGGESGPNARPIDLAWVEDILDQCRMANVPVFVKQLGSAWAKEVGAKHPKGGDWTEWHPDFWAQMWPGESWADMAGGYYMTMTQTQALEIVTEALIPTFKQLAFAANLYKAGDRSPFAARDHARLSEIRKALAVLAGPKQLNFFEE